MTTWSDWISAFVKGPGWFPGTERLGDIMMVPEVRSHFKFFIFCFMLLKQICRRRLYLKTGLWRKMSPAHFILCFGSSCLNKAVKAFYSFV